MSSIDIARLLLEEEACAVAAIENALPSIARTCDLAVDALRAGGRIIYVGAGTSGRLGALDAAEMGPTFGAREGVVVALVAGGPDAMLHAVEGAEDDTTAGADAMRAIHPRPEDLTVGITMSGMARFVAGALGAAEGQTVLVTAHHAAPIPSDLRIVLPLGPEALAGSTRLKGGSATKTVLNMISTAAMARSGAVYGPWMVRVRPSNSKLRDRAERMVETLAEVPRDRAARLLHEAGDDVRVAVLMVRRGLDRAAAQARLEECGGRLREALA